MILIKKNKLEFMRSNVSYKVSEKDKLRRRSLFVCRDIKKGETFTSDNIRSVRPGHGLHPKYMNDILGKEAKMDLKSGRPLGYNEVL